MLDQDDELRRLERRRREEEGLAAPTEQDEPLGLLYPEMRVRYQAALRIERQRLAAILDLEQRLELPSDADNRPAVARALTMPSLRQQAIQADLRHHYALGYTFDSQAAAHPNALAVRQLIREASDGRLLVEQAPTWTLPDPYAVGAALLGLVLERVGEEVPDLAIPELPKIVAELGALRPFEVVADA